MSLPPTLPSRLSPAAQAALKEPRVEYANRHFLIRNNGPRKWSLEGIKDGAWPSYWRLATSFDAAQSMMIDQLLGHVAYLNDMVVRGDKRRDEAEDRASAAERKLDAIQRTLKGESK